MANKDLQTLIRVRKWNVDEKQRAVAVLLRQEDAVLDVGRALELEIVREKAFVGQAEVMETVTFSAYLERCDDRKMVLAQTLVEVRRLIDEARD